MRVLIACEHTGKVRDAFSARGHYSVSCDLLPSETPGHHYCGDVRDILGDDWDLMVCHPPCTYLCSSGMHWNKRRPERAELTRKAVEFAKLLWGADVPRIAMENPIGILSTEIRKPDQIIQPHSFGADASKSTCLWLKGLPRLYATEHILPRLVDGKLRWANQTDSGQNREPPGDDRWKRRSATYPGIAEAMAEQWSFAVQLESLAEMMRN